jgi:hypothetical protein
MFYQNLCKGCRLSAFCVIQESHDSSILQYIKEHSCPCQECLIKSICECCCDKQSTFVNDFYLLWEATRKKGVRNEYCY